MTTKQPVKGFRDYSGEEAKKRANRKGHLSLIFRELGGLIRAAGDLAVMAHSDVIEAGHIELAVKRSKCAEEQIKERYGSYYAGLARDISGAQKSSSPYNYWDSHINDDRRGYE